MSLTCHFEVIALLAFSYADVKEQVLLVLLLINRVTAETKTTFSLEKFCLVVISVIELMTMRCNVGKILTKEIVSYILLEI